MLDDSPREHDRDELPHAAVDLQAELQQLRQAVTELAKNWRAFRGVVLDASFAWLGTEALPFDLRLEILKQSAQRVRVGLERHPDFKTRRPRGLAVAWLVPPAPIPRWRAPFPPLTEGKPGRRGWLKQVHTAGVIRQEYRKQLLRRFPKHWNVYYEWTKSTCLYPQRAHEARLKGFSVWDTVCRRCPRSGYPQPAEIILDFSDAPSKRRARTRLQGRRWSGPCKIVAQRNGPHGFRVLPSYMVWRVNRRRRPPDNANIVVIEDWPHRNDEQWTPTQLQEVAASPVYAPIRRLLKQAAALTTLQADFWGHVDANVFYGELAARLADDAGTTLEIEIGAWEELKARLRTKRWDAPVNELPRNPQMLLDAIVSDAKLWQATSSGDIRARVSVVGRDIHVRRDDPIVPEPFKRTAIIDLTGRGAADKERLWSQGVEVLTPRAVLARLAQTPKRQTKWEQRNGELLAALVEACRQLDAEGVEKTQKAIILRTQGLDAKYAKLSPALLSRKQPVYGNLKEQLQRAYGAEWMKGAGNRVVLRQV